MPPTCDAASTCRIDRTLCRLVEQLPVPAAIAHGEALCFNARAAALTGHGRGELASLEAWFHALGAGDTAELRLRYEADRAAGFPAPRIVALRRRDGTWCRLQLTGSVSGDASIWVLQEAPAGPLPLPVLPAGDWQPPTEGLPLVVYVTRPEPPFAALYVSPQVQALGYTREEWLSNPGCWQGALHAEDRARVLAEARAALAAPGSATTELEYRLCGHDGRVRWFQDRVVVLRDAAGRPLARQGVLLDVTARHDAEAARDAAARRYAELLEEAADAVLLSSHHGVLELVNAAACRMWGAPREALVGQHVSTLFDAAHLAEHPLHISDLQAGQRLCFERVARRADGSTFPVELSSRMLSDGSLQGIARDITARKAADHAVQEERERLHAILEQMPLAVIIAEAPSGRLLAGNAQVEHIFGHPLRPARDVEGYADWEGYHPDGRRVAPHEWPLARAISEGAVTQGQVVRYPRPGAPDTWLRLTAGPVRDRTGRVVAGLVAAKDITEQVRTEEALRRSEARFRTVMERTADFISILDRAGTVRYASPSYGRGLGHAPETLVGQHILTLVHPDDAPRVHELIAQLVAGTSPGVPVLLRVRHADGRWRTVEALAHDLLDTPEVQGLVVAARDVTEQQQLEAQLRQAQKMEAVGRLAGGIAHDFNNLLTIIQAHLGFLREGLAGEPAEDAAEAAHAATRAAELTRQLLVFSRRQVVQPQVVDPGDVVRDLQKMLRRVVGEHVGFVLALAPDAGLVRADRGQLEQVLLNLVVNACDAMPDGGTLTLRTAPLALAGADATVPPGRWVALEVQDTGEGIPAEDLERIFEPFFTTKGPGHGTGLGLATVHGIVAQAGGRVDVRSAPGQGTTFTVLLPACEPAAPELPRAGADARAPGGTETLLVVEDEAAVRAVTRRILSRAGYRVLEARDGLEALEVLDAAGACVDLVVTDAVMPRMGGVELLWSLRTRAPHLPALLVTGYAGEDLARRGSPVADLQLLHKPFTTEHLLAAVRRALAARAATPRAVG